MSVPLILAHYLASLRERGELDALLPELLKAMGHSVQGRPQVGVRQAGVDVWSTAVDSNGTTEVFLFVIKFGDVGRADFYVGTQGVEASIREAANDFVANRLPAQFKTLRKRIVLVTNGVLKQEVDSGFAALSQELATRPNLSLELWSTDQLAPWIEQYLLDESLLLSKGRSDLRAALALLHETNAAFKHFARFVDACFAGADETVLTEPARRNHFLRRCAAAAMGFGVLLTWGRTEGNHKPGVLGGEYLVLRLWAEAVRLGFAVDPIFVERLEVSFVALTNALSEYFDRTCHHLASARALFPCRPERILYSELVLEELGRLGCLLLILQRIPGQESFRAEVRDTLVHLANEHPGCLLPVYDGQSIELSVLFAALMAEGDTTSAQRLLKLCVGRILRAVREDEYLPVDTDQLEDAIALNVTATADAREFFQTSTLIPMLGTVAGLLGDEDTLGWLREELHPLLGGTVTLERWFARAGLETLTGSGRGVVEVGVARALAGFRATAAAEAASSIEGPDGAAAAGEFSWSGTPWTVLVVLSARMHRHPVPTWFLSACAREGTAAAKDDIHAAPAASNFT